jgi:hypothetical protein
MCETCIRIDKVIEQYRQVQRTISDQVTMDRAQELIAGLRKEKAILHPE